MATKSVLKLSIPFEELDLSNGIFMSRQSKDKITFTDFEGGAEIILEGHGFNVRSGKITSGVVEDLVILDPQGKEALQFSGIDLSVKSLPQSAAAVLIEAVIEMGLLQSNIMVGSKKAELLMGGVGADVVKGGGGNDALDGGVGKDVLWGNAGFDQFNFGAGYGKDKIMDFDADISEGGQDLIGAVFADIFSKTMVHGNTVLDFDNGDVLTIVGVRAKDIDATDFVV